MDKKKKVSEMLLKKQKKQHSIFRIIYKKLFSKLNHHQQIKKIALAVGSSLLIGLIFGLVILKMVKQEDPEQASILHTATVEQEEDGEKDVSQFDSISIYVIQAGVFSELENVEKWSDSFMKSGIPTENWEREGSYHLFTGIYKTEQGADKYADRVKQKGFDVYVKEWEVNKNQVSLTENDRHWMNSFLELWNTSLDSLETGESFKKEDWMQLLQEPHNLSPASNELLETLHQDATQINVDQSSETEQRYFLLKALHEYEKFLEK